MQNLFVLFGIGNVLLFFLSVSCSIDQSQALVGHKENSLCEEQKRCNTWAELQSLSRNVELLSSLKVSVVIRL